MIFIPERDTRMLREALLKALEGFAGTRACDRRLKLLTDEYQWLWWCRRYI